MRRESDEFVPVKMLDPVLSEKGRPYPYKVDQTRQLSGGRMHFQTAKSLELQCSGRSLVEGVLQNAISQ